MFWKNSSMEIKEKELFDIITTTVLSEDSICTISKQPIINHENTCSTSNGIETFSINVVMFSC